VIKKSDEYCVKCGVSESVKTTSYLLRAAAVCAALFSGVSCMTTYDAYGRPVQSVDPGVAVAGIAAAGLIGYAAGDDNDRRGHNHRGYYRGYSRHRGYYR
jgi:hypothetical protein